MLKALKSVNDFHFPYFRLLSGVKINTEEDAIKVQSVLQIYLEVSLVSVFPLLSAIHWGFGMLQEVRDFDKLSCYSISLQLELLIFN